MQNLNTSAAAPAPAATGQGADFIDTIVGLSPGDALYTTRHARQKVSAATQASHALFFGPDSAGLPVQERLLVAYYASVLSRSEALATHYRNALAPHTPDAALIDAVASDAIDALPADRLKAMLEFTRTLILKPVEGDKEALQQLQAAGVETPDVVTLAQLVAFLSYQIRLVAGLSAMKAWESK